MQDVQTMWLDVIGVQAYPVFDVHRGAGGRDGRYTYPRRVARSRGYRATAGRRTAGRRAGRHRRAPASRRPVDGPRRSTRGGRTRAAVPLAREVLRAGGRGVVGRGDGGDAGGLARRRQEGRRADGVGDLRHQAGVLVRVDGDHARRLQPRRDRAGPVRHATSTCAGRSRTGTCAENRNHGGAFAGLPDPRRLLSAPPPPHRTVAISGFLYGRGDLLLHRREAAPADDPPGPARCGSSTATRQGASSTRSRPAARPATARRASPTRSPTAGPLRLGQPRLRPGGRHGGRATATRGARRATSSRAPTRTSASIHPFMRGAFRVKARAKRDQLEAGRSVAAASRSVTRTCALVAPRRCRA